MYRNFCSSEVSQVSLLMELFICMIKLALYALEIPQSVSGKYSNTLRPSEYWQKYFELSDNFRLVKIVQFSEEKGESVYRII